MSYSNREKLMNYVQTPPQNDNYVALIILSSTVSYYMSCCLTEYDIKLCRIMHRTIKYDAKYKHTISMFALGVPG